jgi:predicted P-loop ATPase/GTPase
MYSQVITFETVKCAAYAPTGEIEYTETGIESHTIDLNQKTIVLKCDDCEMSKIVSNITDVVRYERKDVLRLSFKLREYEFYVFANSKNGVYTTKKMIVYQNDVIRYDYFLKK